MGREGRRGKVDSTLVEGSSSIIGGSPDTVSTLIGGSSSIVNGHTVRQTLYGGGRGGSEDLPVVAYEGGGVTLPLRPPTSAAPTLCDLSAFLAGLQKGIGTTIICATMCHINSIYYVVSLFFVELFPSRVLPLRLGGVAGVV